MSTYNFGQPPVDALKLQNLQAILNLLPDNSQKLISPKDVRDSIFTTWENIVFKNTKVSTSDIEYIGIDQLSLKSKIFFGKKSVGGKEIMDDLLLNEENYDHFFYGTRAEPTTEHNTRIGLLAGTGSFYKADVLSIPYIEAKETQYTNLEKYIDLDIRNKSYVLDGSSPVGGDINIVSDWGNIQFNGVIFPKRAQNTSSDNNDKYLKFVWDPTKNLGIATWSQIGTINSQSIVSSGTVSISGNPVLINNKNVNFTDATPVPIQVGGIKVGTTFNDVPVTDVLRQLLYPYILPTVTTNFDYTFIESGDNATFGLQKLNYSITFTEQLSQGFLSPPTLELGSPTFPTLSSLTVSPSTGFVRPLITKSVSGTSPRTFTITTTIQDQPSRGNSIVATSSCYVVLPWFYGTSQNTTLSATNVNGILSSFTKLLRLSPSSGESVQFILSTDNLPNKLGLPYFLYPSSGRDLANIFDENGFPVFSDYRKYTINLASPNGFWTNKSYKIYVYAPGGVPTLTTINPLSKYTFVFDTSVVSGPVGST